MIPVGVLFEGRRPPDAIRDLMTRSAQDESAAQPGMLAP